MQTKPTAIAVPDLAPAIVPVFIACRDYTVLHVGPPSGAADGTLAYFAAKQVGVGRIDPAAIDRSSEWTSAWIAVQRAHLNWEPSGDVPSGFYLFNRARVILYAAGTASPDYAAGFSAAAFIVKVVGGAALVHPLGDLSTYQDLEATHAVADAFDREMKRRCGPLAV